MLQSTHITKILRAHAQGDGEAFGRLLPLIYDHLRNLARLVRARSPAGSLETTGLVHEAYLRLVDQKRPSWRDRAHFFAASAQAMRHVLVDAARRRLTAKRGGGAPEETLDDDFRLLEVSAEHAAEVLAVDRALDCLRQLDERMCRVVECLFFAGMTENEAASALGVSARTVHRDWLRARAWLKRELGRTD